MADIENGTTTPISSTAEDYGKDSILSEYCKAAINGGRARCLWICFDRHGRTIAEDISIEMGNSIGRQGKFQLGTLAYRYGWWKRFSIFSAKGVREVKIVFRAGAKKDGFDVLLLPVNHSNSVADIDQQIDAYRKDIKDGTACGIDQFGQIHLPNTSCVNESWNEHDDTYCPLLKISDLRAQQQRLECAEQMLNFYWTTRSNTDCLEFLQDHGFVYSYRELQKHSFRDCLYPYGKPAKALLLVEGWHLRYVMALIGFSIAISLCVIAIVTLVEKDVQTGLAAGSYTIGCAAILLALLTMLSSIL